MNVVLIAAVTADGFIGRDASHLANWTGGADKKLFVEVTKKAGTVVMGSKTYATIGRALPERRNIMYTTRSDENKIEGVEPTSEAPTALIARLESEGATGVAVCGGASIYGLFMAAGVVDELYLTVIGKVFGQGISLFNQPLDVTLTLIETKQLDEKSVLLHYRVVRNEDS